MRSLNSLKQRRCGGHINDLPGIGTDMDSGKLGTTAAWAAKKHGSNLLRLQIYGKLMRKKNLVYGAVAVMLEAPDSLNPCSIST